MEDFRNFAVGALCLSCALFLPLHAWLSARANRRAFDRQEDELREWRRTNDLKERELDQRDSGDAWRY